MMVQCLPLHHHNRLDIYHRALHLELRIKQRLLLMQYYALPGHFTCELDPPPPPGRCSGYLGRGNLNCIVSEDKRSGGIQYSGR